MRYAAGMARPIIWLGGGGTGGHIFPNVAAAQRLREQGVDVQPTYLVSTRPHDMSFLADELERGAAAHTVAARPLGGKPWTWPGFVLAQRAATAQLLRLARSERPAAAVVTGGFVSAPVVQACRRLGVPVLLMNLDAVPGKANRLMARRADAVFGAYPCPLPGVQVVGMPLRRGVVHTCDPAQAKAHFGLNAEHRILLVTGASQGAQSINRMMVAMCTDPHHAAWLRELQVIHLTGNKDLDQVTQAYEAAGVSAAVQAFEPNMGRAWAAADFAVSRAGAGSAAEAWMNHVPCVYLPYPFHRDEHQKFNAQPVVDLGGGVLMRDRIDPAENVHSIGPELKKLATDPARVGQMRQAMRDHPMGDGAAAVAEWLRQRL